jgi:hypothetical protein
MNTRDRAVIAALNFAGQTISSADGSYDLVVAVIQDALIEAAEEAAKAERTRCLEMISRCVKVYQKHERGESDYPARSAAAKAEGCEYAYFVVGEWSECPEYRDNFMPMPF